MKSEEKQVHEITRHYLFHLLDLLARSQILAGDPEAAAATIDSTLARQLDWFPKEYAASLALLGRTQEAEPALRLMAAGG